MHAAFRGFPTTSLPARALARVFRLPGCLTDSFGDFSFGNDPINKPVYYSVGREAVGTSGSDVFFARRRMASVSRMIGAMLAGFGRARSLVFWLLLQRVFFVVMVERKQS